MSIHNKPSRSGANRVATEGFSPLAKNARYDSAPIYRVVEVVRNSEGRLRHEGRVWHNDLALLRKFGRAVAANTSSHRVMITDAVGDVIEELPVAPPEARHSAWDSWGGLDLPPAPAVVRRAAPKKPAEQPFNVFGGNGATQQTDVDVAVAMAAAAVASQPQAEPATLASEPASAPRDVPRLDVGSSGTASADAAAEAEAAPADRAGEAGAASAVPMVPEHEATLP